MQTSRYSIRFEGVSPLVMHNNRCVNPLDPLKKKIAAITSKGSRRLTDADYKQLYRLEFQAGLYYNDQLGPFVPSKWIRATLIAGARKSKDGKQFESGLYVVDSEVPLQYEGPRDLEGLLEAGSYDDGGFMWTAVCGNQRASIMRTRPRFDEWSCEAEIETVDELITRSMIENALRAAEIQCGMGDARSIGFGRFQSTINELVAA